MKKRKRRCFYVYIIYRLNGSPCYVGKGKGRRWEVHDNGKTNIHLARIMKKAKRRLPRMKIVEGLTNEEAISLEIALIVGIGREVHGGPLVNMTDGGEGAPGNIMSSETRRKMSKSHEGVPPAWSWDPLSALRVGKKISAARKGNPLSQEHRDKIKASMIGRTITTEHRRRIGLAHRGRAKAPEAIAKMIASKTGKPWSYARRQAYLHPKRS